MPRYEVSLSTMAFVKATVEVEASDPEEASAMAELRASEGDVVWKYDGSDDSGIETTSVRSVRS